MSVQGSPVITVRNTFVHISSTRRARRSKTQPATRVGSVQRSHGSLQQVFANDAFGTTLAEPLPIAGGIDYYDAAQDTPPSPINLCREVTADGFTDALPSHFSEQQVIDHSGACIGLPPSLATTRLESSGSMLLPGHCLASGMCTGGAPPSPIALCREVTADGFEDSLLQPALRHIEPEPPGRRSRRRPKPIRPPAIGPPPQTMTHSRADSGSIVFRWAVDAKKLRGSDQLAVSPPFELQLGSRALTFRLMAAAVVVGPPGGGRGGGTFRKSQGRGTLRLKCETAGDFTAGTLIFRFLIGSGKLEHGSQSQFFEHDFAMNGIFACKDEWDFAKVVDDDAQVFYVCLEVE